ncbi:MAG: isomerase [Saprospiraceae bacterium]|nr:MAG: isomerase [Saprospiraceae bacterium]
MKILIVGLGSIGRRHLNCLKKIGNTELAALRTSKGSLKEPGGILEFFSIEDALNYHPDGVIIANPTSLHIKYAQAFLENGARVLIEKPIAQDVEEAEALSAYADNLRVAYCMRFLSFYKFLREKLSKETAFKVSFKRSFYLPKWHPYADYRKEYTARKDLGGGVIRTLSHEIDLACHWLGSPVSINGVIDKLSFLELDVDDFAFFSLKMPGGARANFELDYYSPININIGEAFTEKGKYFWDTKKLVFVSYESSIEQPLIQVENDFEDMYMDQMKDFVRFTKTGISENATYNDAVEVMKIIKKVENQTIKKERKI